MIVQAVAGAAEIVADVVKTKTKLAMAFLADRLKDGPVEQQAIAAGGLKAGFGWKILKEAKKRIRAGSVRKGHSWRWVLPVAKGTVPE
jgi:hypothetical protein